MIEYLNSYPLKEPLIFDSHAHYYDEKFDGVRDELLSALPKSGVAGIINCGCDIKSSKQSLQLAEKYGYLYAAVGYHPENLEGEIDLDEIERLVKHGKCVAIGEIGLDYYWRQDNKELQKQIFENQLILANKLGLPVIVHDRDAHADTLELILKHKPKGVLHSFSGSVEMAKELIKIGMYIGIGGVITFKNARKLPDVVKMLPEDKFLLETDAPYLAPVPYRSKINNSAMIYLTAEKIAELRVTDTETVLKTSLNNTKALFKI